MGDDERTGPIVAHPVFVPVRYDQRQIESAMQTAQTTLQGADGRPSPAAARQILLLLWKRTLSGHIDDVESVFCTALRRVGDVGVELAERVEAHHRELALRFLQLEQAAPPAAGAQIERMLSLLADYLELEETDLAPVVVDALDDVELHKLGEQLVHRRMKAGRGSPQEEAAVRREAIGTS